MRLLAVLPLVLGCSFMMVRPPPENLPQAWDKDCTESVSAPVIDTLVTAGLLAVATTLAIGLYRETDSCGQQGHACSGFNVFAFLPLFGT